MKQAARTEPRSPRGPAADAPEPHAQALAVGLEPMLAPAALQLQALMARGQGAALAPLAASVQASPRQLKQRRQLDAWLNPQQPPGPYRPIAAPAPAPAATAAGQHGHGLATDARAPARARGRLSQPTVAPASLSRIGPAQRRLRPAQVLQARVVQRKIKLSTVGRVALAVLKGLVNAVAPFFAGYDYASNLHAIHEDRTGEGVLYGKGMGLAVLAGAKETTQLVAAAATAIGVLLGIASIFVPPVAAAATVAGVVATIAHAVTLVLRGVTFGALRVRLNRVGADQLKRGKIKAQLWNEVGGIVGNILGVIFGGLGGGFTPALPNAPLSQLGQVGSLVTGQAGNSAADAAGGIGAAKARGAEHRAARRQQSEPNGVELPTIDKLEPVEQAPSNEGRLTRNDSDTDDEVDEPSLRQAQSLLDDLGPLAQQHQQMAKQNQAELENQQDATQQGRIEVKQVVDQLQPVEQAQQVVNSLPEQAPESLNELQEKDAPQVQSALKQMQDAMPEVVDQDQDQDVEHEVEPAQDLQNLGDEDKGYLADSESEETQQFRRAPAAARAAQRRPLRSQVQQPVRQRQGPDRPGAVTRAVRKVKAAGRRLLSAVLGQGRRLWRALVRAKARFLALVLKLLGLKQPALDAQQQINQEQAQMPAAVASQQQLSQAALQTGPRAAEAASAIDRAMKGEVHKP